MKNRIAEQSAAVMVSEGFTTEVRYRYSGIVAGHIVLGDMDLPDTSWATEAGLRRLFGGLHESSGLSFEEMEENNSVEFIRA
jgi:hypothetical protein